MTVSDTAPCAPRLHRQDIDGLRAFAVCAIILVHAGFKNVSGGFLGVDVFFVISGYLIHGNISRDIEAGTFRPLRFYGRRLRRTLPALFVMMLASFGIAYSVFMPGEFTAMAQSAIATALSVSNILFLNQVGYFDHDALTKPFLHTWSLGVEEQFYLIAPLLSLGLARARTEIRSHLTFALILVCFVLCAALQRAAPAAAFYLMPARIWEFLIGCSVAGRIVPRVRNRRLAEILAATSLIGLIASIVLCSEASAHPGVATLIPCLATATIIHVGENQVTMVARFLSNPIARFLGLISYSLYLWHWPLIVFAHQLGLPRDWGIYIAVGSLLIVVSALSWRFIEQPFRDPTSPLQKRALPILGGAVASVLLTSIAIIAAHGLPARFGPNVAQITSYFDYANRRNVRERTCFITTRDASFNAFDKNVCLARSETKPNYILIGDSIAAHTWIGLKTVFTDLNVMQVTASGCKPLLDDTGKAYCVDLMNYVLRTVIPSTHVDGLIFSAAWLPTDIAKLAETVAYARRYVPNVYVIGPNPSHDIDLPNLIGRSMISGHPGLVLNHQAEIPWRIEAMMRVALGEQTLVSQLKLACPGHKCVTLAGKNIPFQYDRAHMTTEGSILMAHFYKDAGSFVPSDHVSSGQVSPGQGSSGQASKAAN